jgi:hypothetical protein
MLFKLERLDRAYITTNLDLLNGGMSELSLLLIKSDALFHCLLYNDHHLSQ